MEREYKLFFCDRCGQRLNWSGFDDCEVKYIGWDGVEEDEGKSDSEQVDAAIKKIPPRYTESHGSPWLQYITSLQINQPCIRLFLTFS